MKVEDWMIFTSVFLVVDVSIRLFSGMTPKGHLDLLAREYRIRRRWFESDRQLRARVSREIVFTHPYRSYSDKTAWLTDRSRDNKPAWLTGREWVGGPVIRAKVFAIRVFFATKRVFLFWLR